MSGYPPGGLFPTVETVSQVTRRLEEDFSRNYRELAVHGEISNFRRAASGHMYFVLKDSHAQLKAVMFRGQARGLTFLPADGLEVEASGDITLYAPRGDLQLLVRTLRPAGVGALMEAYTRLKQALQKEGLFDLERKRPLPPFPQTVALVTSPRGAAIRDLIHVARRRWPGVRLVLVPVRVQGDEAAGEIAAAVRAVDRWGGADVMIVGRGGGSLEDLWAFNEVEVVRAVADSATPVVSAVGHESDTTLCDYAADVRAATPSAAAELVIPDRRELRERLTGYRRRLEDQARRAVVNRRTALGHLVQAYGLRRPQEFLARQQLHLDRLRERLEAAVRSDLLRKRQDVESRRVGIQSRHPRRLVESARGQTAHLEARLASRVGGRILQARMKTDSLERALRSLDPSGVLNRGYVWVRHPDGTSVQSAGDLSAEAWLQFAEDRARVRTLEKQTGGPFDPLESNS